MTHQPILRGIKLRCPTCGEGALFGRYLVFNDECPACGQDFRSADTADGPAFFVGFLIMIVFAPFYFILPMLEMAIWLKVVLFAVLLVCMIGVALALLPRFKAVLFNLQLANKAEEAQWESTGKHGTPPKNWKG
ncbi:DUF983 domain-containing protein [Henriciella marina]|uniref:DUF983 domain-containing protein n=1 Tax=Henriciella marina TaxID=453851 RepID=UPI000368296C|nr:DUF983 domain-containing protein [Henriciella marina]